MLVDILIIMAIIVLGIALFPYILILSIILMGLVVGLYLWLEGMIIHSLKGVRKVFKKKRKK